MMDLLTTLSTGTTMFEHTVEPDLRSVLNSYPWSENRVEGELIGMSRGRCANCNRLIDFDDDYAWHVEDN